MDLPAGSLRRLVVKLGTGLLTAPEGGVDRARIARIATDLAGAHATGTQTVVVSSGAVGLGMGRLGLTRRPKELARLQACAAVGQSILTETWQAALAPHGLTVAQILLTRDDIGPRHRHVAVKDLFERLLADGLVPLVNENDSLSTEEIQFGDNDILAALVATLIKADLLVILSTAPGLVDRTGSGQVIPRVEAITPDIAALAGGTESPTARGGMTTKVDAARLATAAGCAVAIGSGTLDEPLARILAGRGEGTLFVPQAGDLTAKKRWLASFERPAGRLMVDPGARRALVDDGKSLLAKGVTNCSGNFPMGALVDVCEMGQETPFARGRCAYASADVARLLGLRTAQIQELFPGRSRLEIIHRDDLVLLASGALG